MIVDYDAVEKISNWIAIWESIHELYIFFYCIPYKCKIEQPATRP